MHILIADDHQVVRKGLVQIIKDEFPEAHCEETGGGRETLEKLRAKAFDIAILDITMPDVSGLDVIRQLKAENNKTPVLILTSQPEEQYAIRVIKAGAYGFIGKEVASEELTTAIRRILSGRKYITESLSEKLANDLSADTIKAPHELLSDREFEVMKHLASGKTVSEISELLFLSVPTISTYRTRVLKKLNLKNNAELMHYAVNLKLV
ncbi:MAG TPA: response regulator transcription factor [Bacteroidia bacterium]|jgi:two-component system invasion response regulator UvrY|nr:response regulator transcription factor [Bacteroidia bacterium]